LNLGFELSADSFDDSPFRPKDRGGAPKVMTASIRVVRSLLRDDPVEYEYGSLADPTLRHPSANSRLRQPDTFLSDSSSLGSFSSAITTCVSARSSVAGSNRTPGFHRAHSASVTAESG